MSDNLTRWLKLFERDVTLSPPELFYFHKSWWIDEARIRDEFVELLIIASAVKWCNTRHEGLTIGDGSWDEKYEGAWPSGFSVEVCSPIIPKELRSGDTLIDALYEAVSWVMEWDEHLGHKPNMRNES